MRPSAGHDARHFADGAAPRPAAPGETETGERVIRTDELVELIALDSVSEGRLSPLVLATGLLALSGAVVIGILGIRVDLIQAMVDPVTVMKWLIPLALMAVAGFGAVRLTHPERSTPVTARVCLVSITAISAPALGGCSRGVGGPARRP